MAAKEEFILQRVLPYSVGAGVFSSPEKVVAYIKNDIKQFKNAANSSQFDTFIATGKKLHQTVEAVEDAS